MADLVDVVSYLEDAIPRAMAEHGIPGLAAGVCGHDDIRWARGYGSTGGDAPGGVTIDTPFSVQSTSKALTATAVLVAAQRGLVDLDAPLRTYLPDFTLRSAFESDPVQKMTLRRLLHHTTGLTHEAPAGSNYRFEGDFAEHIASIGETWLRFPVGHHHEYSNLGVDLAGHIVAQVADERFADFARREVLEPLGMTRSTFDFDVYGRDPDRAVGHDEQFRRAGRRPPLRMPMVPAGGLYASVVDILRYVQSHLRDGDGLLEPELLRQQYDFPRLAPAQTEGYGLCVYVDRWEPGVRVLHHGGAGLGFLCQMLWLPDLGVGAAILTNSVDHNVQNDLAVEIVRRLAGPINSSSESSEPSPPASVVPVSREAAGAYVGRNGDSVRVESGAVAPDAYRFLRDVDDRVRYLLEVRNGEVRYKTSVDGLPPSRIAPEHEGLYLSMSDGVSLAPYRLRQQREWAVVDVPRGGSLDDPITLQLSELATGVYLSATGEILAVGDSGVSYANIPLARRDESP
jgi:CubicO group peptidase (beta-lactamase class C family)